MAGLMNVAFMDSPLVIWIQTFCQDREPVTFKVLSEGVYLNTVMHEIDPRGLEVTGGSSVEERLNTWDILLKNIKTYYQDVLQQFVVMRLPNTATICRDPESEKARQEILRVLLLILGCAVQCERKEEFIGNIKILDIGIQHAIVENIQEITDDSKNVFAIELPEEQQDEVSRCLFSHLTSLLQERDGYVEEIKELSQTIEDLYQAQQQSEAMKATLATPATNTTPEKHHMSVELAETKAKLRKLRQEYEEKSEAVSELMEELDDARTQLNKLRTENSELLHDARSARTYRDEVDILKEKVTRVDKYEAEIAKYKEKLNELEFFKARVEELREDNGVLVETKIMLEDQLASSQKRIDTVMDLENELVKLRQQADELTADRDLQRHKLQEVLEENARLEFEKKSSFNESATLEEELVKIRHQMHEGVTNSLSAQMNETANAKILRLEMENGKLHKQLEEARQNSLIDHAARTLELEKENHRLSKKVEKLQEDASKEHQNALQEVVSNADLQRQTIELERTVETVRESSERQIRELEREKELLETTVETLRERNAKTVDLRITDIENENKRMHERVKEMTAEVSRLEYENRLQLKAQERTKEKIEKISVLEEEKIQIETERQELKKMVTTLKLTCDNYEQLEIQNSDLEVDNEKLSKACERLKESVAKLQSIEQENINLTVENQALKRNIENVRNSSSKLAGLENEKEEYEREINQLKKTVENMREVQSKHEQLEMDLLEMDTENQRLQRALEAKTRHVEELEQDSLDLEKQVDNLTKELDNVRITLRRLETLESEHKSLEREHVQTTREKATLDKENKRIKQTVELKAAAVDELTSQVSALERENKEYMKQAERTKESIARVRELEKENLQLAQNAGVDKRTLVTLREDLVNEKIKSQQLSNDLEKLKHDLEKVGINKEKLNIVQNTSPLADESKFLALEELMQEALTKKMELKEEKIQTLQSRLEESVARNQRLQEEFSGVRRELAVLQQRQEEDKLLMSTPGYGQHKHAPTLSSAKREKPLPPPKPQMTQNATKDILELKDHLITVERKNATLETENKSLMAQLNGLQDRLRHSESQTAACQKQLSENQQQFHTLQSQLAKLQVENTTYQAQNASLQSQNSTLQRQHSRLESEHDQLMVTCDELRSAHDTLSSDHEALQHLHEQLTSEYEALISEHGSLKSNHKHLKNELKEMQQQNDELQRERHTLVELKRSIEQDKEALKTESKSLGNLQMDYVHIKQENILLKSTNEKVNKDYGDLTSDHKAMKAEYNQLQLKFTSQQGQLSEARNQLNMYDVDLSKLATKCESLSQLNSKLEEENRTLMMQLQALLNQNQEMLTQAMDSKDHFHEEERAYMEKLAELRRQKEKLEEKIIEQFKRYDPVRRKSRGFGANLVRKARGLLNRNRSKERHVSDEYYQPESPENSSMGSGDTNESPSERIRNKKMRQRRNSAGDLLESPKLSRQNKYLAQSTTALNVHRGSNNPSSGYGLRGAKSSENLLSTAESPHSRRRRQADADSMSSENSSNRNAEWPSRPHKMPLPGYDELIELKHTRRRTLLDTSGNSSIFQNNHGSQSSEDASHSREPSMEKSHKHNGEQSDDSEDDDLISLNQFLNESNRSPKSRRKLLVSKKIDPEEIRKDIPDNIPEPPPRFLEPRPPVIEDTMKPKTPKTERKAKLGSKSELNISTMTKHTSGSSIGSFATLNQDIYTSTPKQYQSYQMRLGNHQRGPSQSSQQSQSSGSDGRPSIEGRPNNEGQVYATVRPATSAYNLQQRGVEFERERIYNDHGDGNGYKSNHNLHNSVQRKASDSAMHHHTQQHSRNSEDLYSSLTRNPRPNGGSQYGNSHSLPRQQAVNDREEMTYMAMDSIQRPTPSDRPDGRESYGNGSWGQRQYQPEGSDMNSQYTPGNVRNLVQNFHISVQQPPPGGGHQPPVPPPRRHRPLSAGGNLGGNMGGNMGGNGSAFSTPRPQSAVPIGYGGNHPHSSGNNNNNNFSSDNDKGVGRPGSTPPRPTPTGREGAPKNSLWYEYGCV